jgi:hypothetical protein
MQTHERGHIDDNCFVVDDPGRPDSIIYYSAWIKRRKTKQRPSKSLENQKSKINTAAK